MNIAIDCRLMGKSGIGTYIENIVRELVLNHPEHSYLLVGGEDKLIQYEQKGNVTVQYCNIRPFSIKELCRFPVSDINRCDAFFTPYINIPLGIRIPIYVTIHDVLFLDVSGLTSWSGRLIRRLYIGYAVQRAKSIFTVSEFSKSRILSHFRTKKRIAITYNTISAVIKQTQPNIYPKQNSIIYVGNIKPHKGLSVLLKAFIEARKEGLQCNLLLVGEREKFRTVDDAIINDWLNRDDVVFTGYVSTERLIQLIASSRVLVLPSYYEGFGIPPMEALYLGTNVIVSDIPVLKEIYHDLPVTYFKCGDVDDLKRKLLEINTTTVEEELTVYRNRKLIDLIYNPKQIANNLLADIVADF